MSKSIEKKFSELLAIMKKLRQECPWDKKQTPQSLRQYLLEETYEVIDSIDNKQWSELPKELGDLLLQIIFQSAIAEEYALFTIEDVIDNINKKLIERHPHVFDDKKVNSDKEVADNWEHIKMNNENRKSLLSGIPKQAPALLFAQRMQEKAAKVGFDWEKLDSVFQKLDEEFAELKSAINSNKKENIQEEIGDALFTLVNISRFLDINAEDSLRLTNSKFKKRFQYIEEYFKGDLQKMKKATLQELDDLWDKAKNDY